MSSQHVLVNDRGGSKQYGAHMESGQAKTCQRELDRSVCNHKLILLRVVGTQNKNERERDARLIMIESLIYFFSFDYTPRFRWGYTAVVLVFSLRANVRRCFRISQCK